MEILDFCEKMEISTIILEIFVNIYRFFDKFRISVKIIKNVRNCEKKTWKFLWKFGNLSDNFEIVVNNLEIVLKFLI